MSYPHKGERFQYPRDASTHVGASLFFAYFLETLKKTVSLRQCLRKKHKNSRLIFFCFIVFCYTLFLFFIVVPRSVGRCRSGFGLRPRSVGHCRRAGQCPTGGANSRAGVQKAGRTRQPPAHRPQNGSTYSRPWCRSPGTLSTHSCRKAARSLCGCR